MLCNGNEERTGCSSSIECRAAVPPPDFSRICSQHNAKKWEARLTHESEETGTAKSGTFDAARVSRDIPLCQGGPEPFAALWTLDKGQATLAEAPRLWSLHPATLGGQADGSLGLVPLISLAYFFPLSTVPFALGCGSMQI